MNKVVNFKKSEYFVFKKYLTPSIGDLILRNGENLDLSLNYQSAEGGFALLSDNHRDGSEWGLFEKYSPEGKLIEFRLLCMDQDSDWVHWLKKEKDPNFINIEKEMFNWCDMENMTPEYEAWKENPYALGPSNKAKTNTYWTSIDITKESFVIESDNQSYNDLPDVFNDYDIVHCQNGTYDIYHAFIEYDKLKYFEYGYIIRLRDGNEDYKNHIHDFMIEYNEK
tara:strand:+ start:149 stop:820 length:672 start_codon:yes stop_codon:yes gene_type:complete